MTRVVVHFYVVIALNSLVWFGFVVVKATFVRTENMPVYNLSECHLYFLIIFHIAYL